jgi:hypothetical protein
MGREFITEVSRPVAILVPRGPMKWRLPLTAYGEMDSLTDPGFPFGTESFAVHSRLYDVARLGMWIYVVCAIRCTAVLRLSGSCSRDKGFRNLSGTNRRYSSVDFKRACPM